MTLNERISEWFEARPTEPPKDFCSVSPKGFWIGSNVGIYPSDTAIVDWYWVSRHDWDTDEAANARLLEAMRTVEPFLTFSSATDLWEIAFLKGRNIAESATNARSKDRKTAVRLAFSQFAGLDSSGEGRAKDEIQ